MLPTAPPLTDNLRVLITWDSHFYNPFMCYCGLLPGPRPVNVTDYDAQEARKELALLEEELQGLIRAYYAHAGSLPVVGDELNVTNYYHYVPTQMRVARRVLFLPSTDPEVMEVIYYLDCDDLRAYK